MDLSSKLKEVVVVEGYHDLSKIKSVFPNLDIIITNGSEINDNTLHELKLLNEQRGLILLLDADFQGERIRKVINDYVGDTKHIYIPKHLTISKNKKKVGVEHASNETIMEAFSQIKTMKEIKEELQMNTLFKHNLIGSSKSKSLRKQLCDNLGIGLSNGKTLLRKLNMFGFTEEDINNALRK